MNRCRCLKYILILLLTAGFLSSCSGIVSKTRTTESIPTEAAHKDSYSPLEYYVVSRGGKQGVIDERGKTVLPEKFSRVGIISYNGGVPVFLASDGFANINKQGESNGGLYDINSKMLYPGDYREGYAISAKLIQVCKDSGSFGIMSFSGKEVIPCEYNRICICGDKIVAVVGADSDFVHKFYVYDMEGNLLRSKELRIRLLESELSGGKDIITIDDSGRCGLMNTSFENVLPTEWNGINPAGDNDYIVTNDTEARVVNADGDTLLQGGFTSIHLNYDDNGKFTGFSAVTKNGTYVYDTNLKEIFHTDKYNFVLNNYGKFIAIDESGKMHTLGKNGNDIIPAADYIYWDPESKAYVSGIYKTPGDVQSEDTCYAEDGSKLPLPGQCGIVPVSQDKFIISSHDNGKTLYGFYSRDGKELLPIKYEGLAAYKSNKLIFSEADDFGVVRSGVMDYDGNIIIPADFDMLYGDSGSLLYARLGAVYGLVDSKGRWVFNASDYESLMD